MRFLSSFTQSKTMEKDDRAHGVLDKTLAPVSSLAKNIMTACKEQWQHSPQDVAPPILVTATLQPQYGKGVNTIVDLISGKTSIRDLLTPKSGPFGFVRATGNPVTKRPTSIH